MDRLPEIVGIGIAGGRGRRSRPITLKAAGYLRSKAAVPFLGRRMVDWMLGLLKRQGVSDYLMVVRGKENRFQIKHLVGYGETHSVRVRYSRSRHDALNRGSADAALLNLEYYDISRPAFVFPMDSIIEFDLPAMLRRHQEHGAVVTILSCRRPLSQVVGKYGLLLSNPDRTVRGFLEKPTLEEARAALGAGASPGRAVHINAGFYLLDSARLRQIAMDPQFQKVRRQELDFGKDLLPWLVGHGHPVGYFAADRLGDLGSVPDYLATMMNVLRGKFPSALEMLGEPSDREQMVWIPPETLEMRQGKRGPTLAALVKSGEVRLGPHVRLGRYVVIGNGVNLRDCSVGDEAEIAPHVTACCSAFGEGSLTGPSAHLRKTVLGVMSEVQSTPAKPTRIEDHCALGDECLVGPGAHLSHQASIHPHLRVPEGANITGPCEITSDQMLQEYLRHRPPPSG